MTEPKGIDMKLRAAFLLPTLAIGVALILVDVFAVDFLPRWRSSKYLRTSPPRDRGPA